ncbi:MAG TPA: MBL fold metallo-hydrolase, partial [Bryobacteraceae bacterium]|nr:MBL fold metallo-hydrolase [Bryobacteraceae bacterium]
MRRAWIIALTLAGILAQAVSAQVVSNSAKAMGIGGLNSIHYYGVAQNGNLGQNNNSNQPWPMAGANDYVRSIDFTQPASRATWMNYAVPVTGGVATLTPGQQNITPQNTAWAQQLEIWITPWGFLKGAEANKATVRPSKRYQVVSFDAPLKSPSGKPYRVVGYINDQNLVEKVQTWLENPIFGDMLIETEYTHYREGANGLKFPAQIVQKRGGWPTFTAYILGADANPPNIQQLLTPPAAAGRGGAPGGGAPATAAGPTSEKLADGVYRINGAYNSLAIEFADHILLFEPGPQNEARAQAVIAEAKKVIPNKPIRYGVISHHHFDHTSGLPAVVAEGITIVTPEVNKAFLTTALSAPRTLAPDSQSKSGKKPVIEGFKGDKRVFQDASRTFELHVIKGLPHADGLVIGYLPKEKILVYADMFNLPPPNDPVPNPPVVGTMVFLDNIARLNLQPERVMS